jgi:hypothetical protein
MQLAPGPIPPITSVWYDQTIDNPGFADLESQMLADLPTLEAAMDALVNPVAVIASSLPDDGLGPSLDNTDLILSDLGGTDYPDLATTADSSLASLTEQIGNSFAVTPAEAWQVVPDPAVVPDAPAVPTPSNPSTTGIFDLTNPGSTVFTVGDQYQINVNIPPSAGGGGTYQDVSVVLYPWLNNVPQAPINLGTTDEYGNLSYYGQFTAADVGSWGGTVYTTTPSGQSLPGDTLYWTVVAGAAAVPTPTPAPAPRPVPPPAPQPITVTRVPPPQPQVTFVNTTTGNAAHLLEGDSWSLTITGRANAQVIIGGYFNGEPLTPVVLGTTDSAGVFILTGTAGAAEIGAWRETFTVGGVAWLGEVDFIVSVI